MVARHPVDEVAHRLLAPRVGAHIGALADVGANHDRAFAAEQLDGRLADPRCRAGNDRDLACQPLHARLIAN